MTRLSVIFIAFAALSIGMPAIAQTPSLVQGTLIAKGGAPFHLKATITEGHDPSPVAEVEMYWAKPDLWRRSIVSQDFTQTLIVDGNSIYEKDSDDYFPLAIQTLVTAMVDPRALLAEYRPGDMLMTKANGASTETGLVCFDAKHCFRSQYGLLEEVGAAGHSVDLMDYQKFDGKRIARRLIYMVSVGDFMTAEVTKLEKLKNPNDSLFHLDSQVPGNPPIRIDDLSQTELLNLALEKPAIIWPQTLDGAETGQASFYFSIDREGQVREVHPVRTANERTNDSAIRQLMRWKFKPAMKDGQAVQAEGMLTFSLNTRAFGPVEPLTDEEMRKMAANPVSPAVAGTFQPGTTFKMRVAVDSDGQIIEEIVVEGPPDLFEPCDAALKHWQFKPIIASGQPRPYRGLVEFKF
ncbi:MAG TPA: energy transducer TonB [Acidobacteriaceae bacterium]|nr:energy transducer TonB [Acidobacteriaceae bacterium]